MEPQQYKDKGAEYTTGYMTDSERRELMIKGLEGKIKQPVSNGVRVLKE